VRPERRATVLLLFVLSGALLGVERPAGLGDVEGIRHWSYPSYTRVVVELSGPVMTEVQRLPADPAAGRPERLFLDLPEVWVGLRYDAPIPVGDGLLRRIRLGQNTLRTTRLVIDLQNYDHHRIFTLSGPDRVVVDVYAAEPEPDAAQHDALGTPPKPPIPSVHRIVLDPGHGGTDPGAMGRRGLVEKDVTLAIAKELRKDLIDRGFEVVMTRDEDRTLSLEERTAIAEGSGADVFVSIHVNAAARSRANGIETYYLDHSHERHTLALAARESGVSPEDLDPLQKAMATIRVEETSVASKDLANDVQEELVVGVRNVFGSVRDLGAKQGPFHVLFLSGAPAVLVETGFLTNRRESDRLASDLYRAVVAERIARGLSRYRTSRMSAAPSEAGT
jgi:N-acetylmuramoyl-L-alanine amidase